MINLNEMFKEFNNLYGLQDLAMTPEALDSTVVLIQDEVEELKQEKLYFVRGCGDKANTAKELTDILYITMQKMTQMGLDVEACLKEVHQSNMSKLVHVSNITEELKEAHKRYSFISVRKTVDPEYGVMLCTGTGKVIKPMGYKSADMGAFVND